VLGSDGVEVTGTRCFDLTEIILCGVKTQKTIVRPTHKVWNRNLYSRLWATGYKKEEGKSYIK